MSHLKHHQCDKKHGCPKCPCTKEIAASIPVSTDANKNAILPTVTYLNEIPAPLTQSSNYTLATNLSGLITIEGSFMTLNLGPYSLSNPGNTVLHIKNSDNITILRGTIIGNILVENCSNINFVYGNRHGNLTINDSTLCKIRYTTLQSDAMTLQMNNCKTCSIFNTTIVGGILCTNSSTIDIGQNIIELKSLDSQLHMNNVIQGHVIDVVINGNNIASKALTFENCNDLIVKLIDAKNILDTHIQFDNSNNIFVRECLLSSSNCTSTNGVLASNCKNLSFYFTQFYDLKGDAINIVNCKGAVCDGNVIIDCGRGIVVNSNGATIQNNTITTCRLGIVNQKKTCNAYFSNRSSFCEEHNYRHVPHLTVSGPEACGLNNIGPFMNLGFIC